MHPGTHCGEHSTAFVSPKAKWPRTHPPDCELLANRSVLKCVSALLSFLFPHTHSFTGAHEDRTMRPKALLLGHPKSSSRTGLGRTRHAPRELLKWGKSSRRVKEQQVAKTNENPHTCSTLGNHYRQGKRKQAWSLGYFHFCRAFLPAAQAVGRSVMRAGAPGATLALMCRFGHLWTSASGQAGGCSRMRKSKPLYFREFILCWDPGV